mgnify:FL=1
MEYLTIFLFVVALIAWLVKAWPIGGLLSPPPPPADPPSASAQ